MAGQKRQNEEKDISKKWGRSSGWGRWCVSMFENGLYEREREVCVCVCVRQWENVEPLSTDLQLGYTADQQQSCVHIQNINS